MSQPNPEQLAWHRSLPRMAGEVVRSSVFQATALLLAELIGLSAHFDTASLQAEGGWIAALLGQAPIAINSAIAGIGIFALLATVRTSPQRVRIDEHGLSKRWLVLHALALLAFFVLTSVVFSIHLYNQSSGLLLFFGWILTSAAFTVTWMLLLAPASSWIKFLRSHGWMLLVSFATGAAVSIAASQVHVAWVHVSKPTMVLVYGLIRLIYSNTVYSPDQYLLGTASFQVEIASQCSGYEGVALITGFLGIYLWLLRDDLKFPHSFLLFPLGIVSVWIANVLRIAALVMIGSSISPDIAAGGFHSQAGWICFTVVALGLIALSHRKGLFLVRASDLSKPQADASISLLIPLVSLLATSMVTAAFSAGFDLWYPLKVAIAVFSLWHFRRAYRAWEWTVSWQAVAVGVVVFVIWMALEPGDPSSPELIPNALAALGPEASAAWILFRLLGSVIVVPMAEELAFRGYLLHKLTHRDFQAVQPGQFSVMAFLVSSLLFGLLHERWLAATVAGLGYALILKYRGRMPDAIVAHATTNALIAMLVLAGGQWTLWN